MNNQSTLQAFHFVNKTLRDGTPIPGDGEVLRVNCEPILCKQGLHASIHPFDALQYAPGNILCRVALGGTIVYGPDKVCATERTILARFDATLLLRRFARQCALRVIGIWDAPPIVVEYLQTGNEDIRAAARAAASTASAPRASREAASAAWAAARALEPAAAMSAAAWEAARASQSAVARTTAAQSAQAAAAYSAWAAAAQAAAAAMRDEFFAAVNAGFNAAPVSESAGI